MSDAYVRADAGGGLTVMTETMPGIRSASVGVWVRTGSIHEQPAEMGVSHLLEHMVFKGTTRRTARDLALVLERVGGSLDAYTTREHTCYTARVLDEYLDLAVDVLADLVVDPLLRAEDLDLERDVVLEEISTVDDTPDDLVFDLHATALFGDHPYGYSILGTRETVKSLTAEDLRRVHSREYRRSNLVIAAAGNVHHDRFLESVRRGFERVRNGHEQVGVPALSPLTPREIRVKRAAAQTHIVLGTRAFGHSDPRRYALVMLCNAFGGGMSSRLFQRVREELALAYSVHAFQTFYQHAGVCGVYVGTRPDSADRAAGVIAEECNRLVREGLTQEELDDVKGQVKGHVVLSLESSSSRMHRLAGTELYDEPYLEMDEIMRRVDAVTLDEVHALAAEFFDPAQQVIMRLGPEAERKHAHEAVAAGVPSTRQKDHKP